MKRAPRILYCTDTFPPQVNGVSVVTALSAAAMQERGWECGVIAPEYPKPYGSAFASVAPELSALPLHLKIPSTTSRPYPDVRLAAPMYGRVLRSIREFDPDLVHCQTEFVVGRLGQLAAGRLGIPRVSSYHTDFSRYTESYKVGFLRPLVSRYIGRFHRRSVRVYTPSEPARADLARFGVSTVEVWGRGVDGDQFHPRYRSTAVRKNAGMDDAFVFLHVGRLAAEKNVTLILDAFDIARRRAPEIDMRLIVAGDGPEAAALHARGGEGVWFCGNIDRQRDLPALYASADAFVFSSETETLGLVILEAMASGLPVVAAPAGGVADNLRHELNGLAFRAGDAVGMADAMLRVATEAELRARLAREARGWAEARSWRAEMERLDASYREVIATAADRARGWPARDLAFPA